ncbi:MULTISPECIES: efflux RND transporter periplasmic adaptor subunit [Providencia]|uniref:efflux RND transporter periplasmic adaptor subunit n=1 Tax=Providencia TaxID=586 RepID=UPI001C5B89C4|nr:MULTISPECIES: HlyD family secretion protein [Providencia]ELR5151195.1 HlyD family secretion protein [Providencia rettgeri]QXX84706.1 HlyD family secretion protein [Providencia sp. R33]
MNIRKYLIIVLSLFIIISSIYLLWNHYALSPWTRDGRIRAEINQVTAEVSGKIDNLLIIDNQEVKKGDLLLIIDPTDYEIKVRQSELELNELVIQHNFAKNQLARRTKLNQVAISKEELEDAQSRLASLTQKIELAKVKINKAKLDLSRTKISSPVNGFITNLNLRAGNYINAGSPLFAIVDKDSYYVIAYLEETKMTNVVIGDSAKIQLYGNNNELRGKVQSIGRAIDDNNSSTGNQLLENVQPNYPWVRLAQRVPVKISLQNSQNISLIPGTTCTVFIEE